MEGLLAAPPANEICNSKCPAKATDTVQIKNVEGDFYFCHHHADKIDPAIVQARYSSTPKEIKVNVHNLG